MGILDSIFGKKKKEQEDVTREQKQRATSMREDLNRQLWEQFGKATGRKVITTGHLLLLQQLVGDALFVYKHPSDTSQYPSYMWADKRLLLGDNSFVNYAIPFLWVRTLAKENVSKFDEVMELLNHEYSINVDSLSITAILHGITQNGFQRYQPQFDINANRRILNIFYKDSSCLLRFINFFGDNVDMRDMLPSQTNRVYIASASPAVNELINEMVDAFRKGSLAK